MLYLLVFALGGLCAVIGLASVSEEKRRKVISYFDLQSDSTDKK